MPDEQRLLARLLGNYERSVRPVFNASHTVLIHFGLTLIHILDMVSGDSGLVVIRQAVSGCCVTRRRSAAAWCLSLLLLRLPFSRMRFGRFLPVVSLAFVFVVVIAVVVTHLSFARVVVLIVVVKCCHCTGRQHN